MRAPANSIRESCCNGKSILWCFELFWKMIYLSSDSRGQRVIQLSPRTGRWTPQLNSLRVQLLRKDPNELVREARASACFCPPTLHSWKFSDTSVSWMSISLGVGAAVGVPAALPHDGDPTVPPGEDVVNPSNTLRNFFISPGRSCVCSGWWAGSKRRLCLLRASQSLRPPFGCRTPTRQRLWKTKSSPPRRRIFAHTLSLRCNLKSHRGTSSCCLAAAHKMQTNASESGWCEDYSPRCRCRYVMSEHARAATDRQLHLPPVT